MDEIINSLIQELELKEKIIGVLQYGSSLRREDFDKFSDIDILFVIKDEFYLESSRGSFLWNKIEIEYFIETEEKIYKELLEELDTLIPINRNRFLTGRILLDKENKIKSFRERAYQMCSMPYTKMNELDIKKNAISFHNRLQKLKRKKVNRHKDFEFYYYRYVNELIETYSHINAIPLIVDKLYNSIKNAKDSKKYFQYEITDEFCRKNFLKIIEKPNLNVLENVVEYIFKKYIDTSKDYRLFYYKNH